MPNITATNSYANLSATVGGPYLDNHAPANLVYNDAPPGFIPSASQTIQANDVSGTASSTNEPGFSTRYTTNSSSANQFQGVLV